MTRSRHASPLGFRDIDDIAAALRLRGERFSTPRRLVVEALFDADGAVSAEHIANGSDGRCPRLDLTSVYRTLDRLEELGVVTHMHVGHGPGLYALTRRDAPEYVVCERCERVTTIEPAQLEPVRAFIGEHFGYEVSFGHFPLVGICRACADADDGGVV
jgi:Fur family ferric uptake transcriptional regulator